jgi:hypothetical protein
MATKKKIVEDVKKAEEYAKKEAVRFWPLMKLQPWRFAAYTSSRSRIGYVAGKHSDHLVVHHEA